MTQSPIDLSKHADLIALVELVAAIRKKWPQRELLLVGATARDILLSYAHGIAIERATFDLDFAIAVADWDDYLQLRNTLLAEGEFIEEKGALHRLILPPSIKLDLIPFGGVERPDRTIAWPPDESQVMQLMGYREAMNNGVRLYSEQQLFAQDNYDVPRAGAWLFGKDIRDLLSQNKDDTALKATMRLLEIEVNEDGPLHLARDMPAPEAQQAYDLLKALHAGLNGEPFP